MDENTIEKKRSTPSAKQAIIKRKPAPAKAVAVPKAGKKDQKKKKAKDKVKVVRDFAMLQAEYAKLVELKQACIKTGMSVKKTELLRAGLHALGRLSVPQLKQVLSQVVQIKAGRPQQRSHKSVISE